MIILHILALISGIAGLAFLFAWVVVASGNNWKDAWILSLKIFGGTLLGIMCLTLIGWAGSHF